MANAATIILRSPTFIRTSLFRFSAKVMFDRDDVLAHCARTLHLREGVPAAHVDQVGLRQGAVLFVPVHAILARQVFCPPFCRLTFGTILAIRSRSNEPLVGFIGRLPLGAVNRKPLWIDQPNRGIEERLRARGTESEAAIQTRLAKASWELDHRELFHYVVENKTGEIDNAVSEILQIIEETTARLKAAE